MVYACYVIKTKACFGEEISVFIRSEITAYSGTTVVSSMSPAVVGASLSTFSGFYVLGTSMCQGWSMHPCSVYRLQSGRGQGLLV